MAYAAVISLKHTIHQLYNSSDLWIIPHNRVTIECENEVNSLEQLLQKLDGSIKCISRKKVDALDEKIREAVSRFEDVLESHLSDQILKQSEDNESGIRFFRNMLCLKQEVQSFITGWQMENLQVIKAVSRLDEVLEYYLSDQIGKREKLSEEMECLRQEIEFLTLFRSLFHGKETNSLQGHAASRLQDLLEFNLYHHTVSTKQIHGHSIVIRFIIDMHDLMQEVESFTSRVKKMKKEYMKALKNLLPEDDYKSIGGHEEEEDDGGDGRKSTLQLASQHVMESSVQNLSVLGKRCILGKTCLVYHEQSSSDVTNHRVWVTKGQATALPRICHGRKTKFVGLSTELSKLKNLLTSQHRLESSLRVISVLGMAGIGKTALVKEVFEDPDIREHFNHRVWVTAGSKCKLEKIQLYTLSLVNPEINIREIEEEDSQIRIDASITHNYIRGLEGKSYLIVLDDVWDKDVWMDLKSLLPIKKNKSAVLLTTRLHGVCKDNPNVRKFDMRLLNEDESWDLLRCKVFGEARCPPQLEKAGKKIAKKCAGLPLTIVTVARFLSNVALDPECWNEVAEKDNSVFIDAYQEMCKVLHPSYKYLPQHLKPCFLYMGLFNEKFKIPRSNLINMWVAEGFLEPDKEKTEEEYAVNCLEGLFYNSVMMIYQYSSIESLWVFGKQIKTCGLHSAFWHFCNREAGKNEFFHVLKTQKDCVKKDIKSQRRLCFRNNILFGIQDLNSLIGDDGTPSARSLLCYGPYNQYQVPVWFGLRLLRVLDALNIRFYEFPLQVLKLVQLRYFALTFNGDLPTSISKLRKLQHLIVHRHLSIRTCRVPSYLPMEIWDMEEIKHLEVMGSDLQVPSRTGILLPNLHTLLGVSARSCSKEILGRLFKLRKFGVQIELGMDTDEPLRWFDHMSHFRDMESLKCVVVNPESNVVTPPPSTSVFPWGLKRLTLSGLGYPWEDMRPISCFFNLEVLKLQCYAFRGPKWEIESRKFMKLSSLMIEDTDLEQWQLQNESLPSLVNLSLKHCYKLKEINWEHDKYFNPRIEIVDCNPLAISCVKKIIEDAISENAYSFVPHLDVHSSYLL